MHSVIYIFTQKTKILSILWLDAIISSIILLFKVSQKHDSCYSEQTFTILLCHTINFYLTVSFLSTNTFICFISAHNIGKNNNNNDILIYFIVSKIICIILTATTIVFETIVFWYYKCAASKFLQLHCFIAGIIIVFQLYSIRIIWKYLKTTRTASTVGEPPKKFTSVATIWIGDTCNLISSSNSSSLTIESIP